MLPPVQHSAYSSATSRPPATSDTVQTDKYEDDFPDVGQAEENGNVDGSAEPIAMAETDDFIDENNPDINSGTEESKQGGKVVVPRPAGRFETTQTFKDDQDMASYNDFLGQFAVDSCPPTPDGQVVSRP